MIPGGNKSKMKLFCTTLMSLIEPHMRMLREVLNPLWTCLRHGLISKGHALFADTPIFQVVNIYLKAPFKTFWHPRPSPQPLGLTKGLSSYLSPNDIFFFIFDFGFLSVTKNIQKNFDLDIRFYSSCTTIRKYKSFNIWASLVHFTWIN